MRPRALLRGTGSNLIKVSTGRMYFVPEGQHVVARHEVPGSGVWTFGPRPKVLARNLVDASEVHADKPQLDLSKASAVRMYFVPEGQHDRSQARSAWESVPRKNRPVRYGMIGRS